MNKLLTVLTGVMLTMPLAALDVGALPSVEVSVDVSPASSMTGWCWVWTGSGWIRVPC